VLVWVHTMVYPDASGMIAHLYHFARFHEMFVVLRYFFFVQLHNVYHGPSYLPNHLDFDTE
jgi:hypothetical protein